MIVSRAPLRFSLGGGGSDLPAYAEQHGGFVVSAAIDKYVYVTANRRFYRSMRLAYSRTEIVERVDDVQHPIFREALAMLGITHSIELTSVAELPSNSGLGSSSTFTVALLNALHAYKREFVSSQQLAEEACALEIDRLGEPIGRQDQYIAAYGNITALRFEPGGAVHVEPVPVSDEVIDELESNLVIVYSGVERQARSVLSDQTRALGQGGAATDGMHRIKALGHEVYRLLTEGDVDGYGELLHEHWTHKRKQVSAMSDASLDEHYAAARKAGAIGGKLMGAGGGGFFMFYVRPADKRRLIEVMEARGLRRLRFHFEMDGARIMANLQRSCAPPSHGDLAAESIQCTPLSGSP
jgi:D-glycero-alpha-D-manno-heptose-7-phosphate kinase